MTNITRSVWDTVDLVIGSSPVELSQKSVGGVPLRWQKCSTKKTRLCYLCIPSSFISFVNLSKDSCNFPCQNTFVHVSIY